MPLRIGSLVCLGNSCHVSSAPLRLISRRCLALACQFLSRLCLRFACLCNAIATLACHFEASAVCGYSGLLQRYDSHFHALASPNCDLLCHRLTPPHLALAIQFLSMPPHDSSLQSKPLRSPASHIYAFTSHSSLYRCIPRCAVTSHFRAALCLCVSFCAVPLPLLVFRYYAFANHHGSAHCRAVALHTEPSLRSATLRLTVSLLSQQSHSKSPPRKAVAIMRFLPTGISPCLNFATDQVHGVFHNQATHELRSCPNPPGTRW